TSPQQLIEEVDVELPELRAQVGGRWRRCRSHRSPTMADFFLSVPGVLSTVGVGALILLRGGRPRLRATRDEGSARLIMQIAISAVVLGSGLWVILSGH